MRLSTQTGFTGNSSHTAFACRNVRIIGVPSGIAGRKPGPEAGPRTLREAGLAAKLAGSGRGCSDAGDIAVYPALGSEPLDSKLKHQHAVALSNQNLANAVEKALEAGEHPLILGGDHSFAIGSLAGAGVYCARHGLTPGLLWIDAHPDINTPLTTPSGNIHGMPVAAALGLFESELSHIGEVKDILPQHIAYIGLRSIDPGEAEAIARLGILAYGMDDVRRLGMSGVMSEISERLFQQISYLHVSFDLDSADPSIAPGVSTPEPNGLTLEELALVMRRVSECSSFRSMDIAELNPSLDSNGITASFGVQMAAIAMQCGD